MHCVARSAEVRVRGFCAVVFSAESQKGDSSYITTESTRERGTVPERRRPMPQVGYGAAPVPSLTLRVSMWDD
jgi:hypothetical protein